VLLVESTYGNRLHPARGRRRHAAGRHHPRAPCKRGGSVLLPSFAVGRAQALLLLLQRLKRRRRDPGRPADLPGQPDGHRGHRAVPAHRRLLRVAPREAARLCDGVRMVDQRRQSMRLTRSRWPAVIISASGMATGGRVLHHLKAWRPIRATTSCFPASRSAAAAARAGGRRHRGQDPRRVRAVRAQVSHLEGFSGHADADELMAWLRGMPRRRRADLRRARRARCRRHAPAHARWPCLPMTVRLTMAEAGPRSTTVDRCSGSSTPAAAAELRFRRPGLQVPSSAGELPEHFVGRRPWEVGELQLDPVAQQANMQALQRREPFDIVVRSQPSPGRPEEMVAISGRPRHTEDGRFAGYWGVGRNVTAQLRHEQQLAEARDAAEAANRAKSMFLANISHEIRTPLNGLVGLTELARRSDIGESRRRELLDMLADSATALTQVISDLLDLARIEAGRFELRRMDFDLAALLASLRRAYGVLCEAQGLRFQLDAEPGLPAHVHGDPTRLRQVLANYLNNALKFGRRGTVSLVARRCGPDRLRFEVVDEGDGIAEVDLPRLFTPFEQLHSGRDRRSGGSGLGLAICRELALLMDGQVGVASHAGAGSRFWVELPLPEAAAAPATPATPVDDGRLAGMSVLLAEDNAVNRMIGEALLAHWRVRVHTVGDGREALQAVEQAAAAGVPFELVLMDIQMPELDGLAATRALRLRWSASELPVVALTASVLEDERRAARDAGMNDFLAKPIDAADLFGLLRRVREARGTPHADRLPSVTAGHALGASRPAGQAQPGVHPPGPPGHHPGR
jgi:signal transduction histidine kinase/DNA-binding NarL/FixJ family response regulator